VLSDLAPVLQARLQETLALLSSGGGAPPEASQLQAQVERSGLNYEAQVQRFLTAGSGDPALAERDLKGQLLELVQRLHQATAKAPSRAALEMVTHVEHALDTLEGQQVANQLAWQQQQPILIPLPNPLAAGIPTAQLWVQRHPPAPDTPTPELPAYRLVLLLDVSALGPLRVEALWHGSQLTATIQVHEPSVAAFISAQVTGFTDLLSALGVQAELTCRVQPPVQPALDDPLVACLRTSASGLVDLTI
jgi:hypothetical protein